MLWMAATGVLFSRASAGRPMDLAARGFDLGA